ncbi:TPA: phage tail tape measure protein [Vibrio parahaemolyticus]|nr:phage tail tape measure protein [Vibrio parahaemolyticus]
MAFTIDFATSNATQKVNTLKQSVDSLSSSASKVSLRLEQAFKTPTQMRELSDNMRPMSKQISQLSNALRQINSTPLQNLYRTLDSKPKSLSDLGKISTSVDTLARSLPRLDERPLEALFNVLKSKPKDTGDLRVLATSFTAIAKALPQIQPTPIRKLFNALENYRPIGSDLQKLGVGFSAIGKALPTINPKPIEELFKALGHYKPIGNEFTALANGLSSVSRALPKIDSAKLKELFGILSSHKFDGEQLRKIANAITSISRSSEKLNPEPIRRTFEVIRNYPKVAAQLNELAQALHNLARAQSMMNSQAMRKIVGNAMAGQSDAAKLMGFSAEQIKVMESVGAKLTALAEGKRNVRRQSNALSESTNTLNGKFQTLNKNLGISDQQSAALRAAMNSLGTHMGIFTGRTIAVATAVYTTISAFREMVTVGTSFSKEMIRASAVMGATDTEYLQLENRVRDLAKTTIFTGVQVAQGLTYLGMAGLNTQEAIAALEPSLNIAKIGMIDFSESADIVTNVLRAFKLNAEDLSGVADDLATAITNSNATIQQLAKALSYVAPIAYAAGGSLREVTALLSVMHDVGIKSSRAGTALRRAYGNLLAPTAKVSRTLNNLGIQSHDANGRLRSMVSIFVDLSEKGATSADIMNLFGVRASSALQSVLDDVNSVNPKLRTMMEILGDNDGAAKDLGAAFEDYLGADAQKLVSALQDKFIEIFKVNEKGFRDLVKEMTRFVQSIDAQAVGDFVSGLVKVAKYLMEISVVLGTLATYIIGKQIFLVAAASVYQMATGLWKLVGYLKTALKFLALIVTKMNPFVAAITGVATALWMAYEAYQSYVGKAEESIEAQKKVNDGLDEEIKRREKLYDLSNRAKSNPVNPAFGEQIHGYMNKNLAYQTDNSVIDRINTMYANQRKELDEMEKRARTVYTQSRAAVSAIRSFNFDSQASAEQIDKHLAQQEYALKVLRKIRGDKILLQKQIADAYTYNVLPEDIDKRINYRDDFKKAAAEKDYDIRANRIEEAAERQVSAIERLKDLDLKTDKEAMTAISKIESSKFGALIADKTEELAEATKRLEKIQQTFNIDKDGNIPTLAISEASGKPIVDTKSLGGLEEWKEARDEVRELTDEMISLRHEAGMTKAELRHDWIVDVIDKADFEDAVKDIKEYNSTVDTSIEKVEAEIKAIKTGIPVREALLKATELNAQKEWAATIIKQESAIASLEQAGADQKVIEKLREKTNALKAEKKVLDEKLDVLKDLRDKEDKAKEHEKEVERLKRLRFLPKEQRTIDGYDENLKDIKKYFTMVRGMEEDAVATHEDFLKAKLALDQEYFEAAYPIYNELFESISSEMKSAITDAVVYGATWEDTAARIRNALYEGVVNALVQEGIELAKNGIIRMVMAQREVAAETAVSSAKVAGKAAETASEVASISTVAAAEKTASAASASTIGTLLGQGAEMAAAWSAAAVNVSTATFGAAALAGSAALTTAQALNFAMSMALSAAGGAAGGVKGREFGGRVEAGQPYLVGERSAEVFVPDRAGTIITERQNKQKGSPFGGGEDSGSNGASASSVKIINAIDPQFIKDYLASSEGEEIIVNHIQRNRGNI